MLIDTHCHLHDREWFTPEQSEEFLAEAVARDVQQIICIGTDPADSEQARLFAEAHENVFWTYGIHPEFANHPALDGAAAGMSIADLERLKEQSADCEEGEPREDGRSTGSREISYTHPDDYHSRLVAIGEIGLDYHYDGYDRKAQIRLLERMLQLALDLDLPASLHLREAFADAFAVLDNFPKVRGVVHSFTGSKRDLRQALERGFYIGVNGLMTYNTLPIPPLDRILLETDAPFLTPAPFRGTINKPGYICEIAASLAEKTGVTVSTIAEQTTQNANQIFHLTDLSHPNGG